MLRPSFVRCFHNLRHFFSCLWQPDWSLAREDLRTTLESASLRGGIRTDPEFWGVPVLVVIPVKDSALQRGDGEDPTTAERIRASILQDAWEGLGLKGVAELGFSFRVVLVGLHEFESRSKAAAASTEGLVFAGGVEQSSSEDLAAKLAELAGNYFVFRCFVTWQGAGRRGPGNVQRKST